MATKILTELSVEEINRLIESIDVRIQVLRHDNFLKNRDLISELERLKVKLSVNRS